VDPVKNEPPRLVRKIDDSLDPKQVLALGLNELVDPAVEPRDIDRPTLANRCAGDIVVVLMCAVGKQLRVEF